MKWTTADGTQVEIRDMADGHLLNAHRYVRRMVDRARLYEEAAAHPVFAPRGEMAKIAFEQEWSEAEAVAESVGGFEGPMREEIERRGLVPLPVPVRRPLPKFEVVDDSGPGTLFRKVDGGDDDEDTDRDNQGS